MQTLELNPRPSILMESLRSMGYTLETALADVVDNSVAVGARNISVRFLWANGDPWIAILDDGHGMPQPELIEAMRFGSSSPTESRSTDDLGRFGLGMKTASISQCRVLTVISRSDGKLTACSWDMDLRFRLIRKEVLNKLIRVRVDIPNSLDALWKIDVKKAEADPPETVLRELCGELSLDSSHSLLYVCRRVGGSFGQLQYASMCLN